jgi:nucleoside-diphosphate-sugar epimerase
MKALVTGAAGFIGSYLTEALVEKGFQVTCIARKTSRLRWIEHLELDFIYADLADSDSYADSISRFDYIFHIAGRTKAVSEKDFFSANTECTRRLLKVTAEKNPGLRRFVYLSSLAAAGPSKDGSPVQEDCVPSPVSSYGRSKLEAELAVLEYKDRFPVTIIRPPAVYGPRDADLFVMFKMIKKGIYPYWGKCLYSLIYVEDLVQGIIAAAEKEGAEGETFFLSDEMIYTNDDIIQEISKALGVRPVRVRLPRSLMPFVAFLSQKADKTGIINRDKVR